MESKCPYWPTCGAALARHYWLKQTRGDQSDWMGTVCAGAEEKFQECPHYELRANPKEKEEPPCSES